jgi:hypothetical protein
MVTIGRRGWVNIAVESSPGVPASPSDIYIPFLECSLMEKMTPIPELQARGIRDEQGESSVIGKKWGEGTLKVNLDPTLAPVLLGLAMGDFGTPTSEGSGVYTHTFARKSDNTPKTASVIFDRIVDRMLFPYLVVNSAEISFSDGLAEVSADCLSRFPVTSTSGTLATVSGTLFSFRNATIKMGANLTEAESATALKVREFSLTINNNAEPVYVIGNNDVDSIPVKNFGVTGHLALLFEDTTQRDIFRNLTKKAMIVTLTGNGIGGGMYEFVKFRIAKLRFESYTPAIPIDDLATEGIDFVGEYSSSDAKTLDIQVRNRRSSYTS